MIVLKTLLNKLTNEHWKLQRVSLRLCNNVTQPEKVHIDNQETCIKCCIYLTDINQVDNCSYIIIDNAFEEGQYFTSGIPAMQIAISHEYFHAIQRNYAQVILGYDKYFWELSATWIEEVIYPSINDYIYWMDYYLENPEQNISDYLPNDPGNDAGYSLAMFGNYLTKIYDGVEDQKDGVIMKKIWETFNGLSIGNAHLSINQILNSDYNSNFINAWLNFNSRNIFNGLYDDMNSQFSILVKKI